MFSVSVCCVDIAQPFQPKDRETTLSMAYNKHTFMGMKSILGYLHVCTSQCKVLGLYRKIIEKQSMFAFGKKKHNTYIVSATGRKFLKGLPIMNTVVLIKRQ